MKKSQLRKMIKSTISEVLSEARIKKGSIVIAKKGVHKGDKHEVIHDFGNGKFNVRPLSFRNKYRMGAAGADAKDLMLVKETREQVLNERFASRLVQDMFNKMSRSRGFGSRGDRKFFNAASKAYGIEWDKLSDDAISGPTARMKRKGLEFILSKTNQTVKGTGKYDYERAIAAGQLLGVAMNGKAVYFGKSGLKTGAPSSRDFPEYVGLNVMGFKNADSIIKRLSPNVEVYQVDISKAGGAKEKQQARKDARRGATALLDFNTIRRENQARYEKALTDRLANSSPVDQAYKMVEAAQKMAVAVSNKDIEMLKKGMVRDSWSSSGGKINNAYNQMFTSMQRLLSFENQAIKAADKDKAMKLKNGEKPAWSEEKYYLDQMISEARNIQRVFKELKADLSKLSKDKDYVSINPR